MAKALSSEAMHHLAQINIGKALAEMDSPIMHGFVSNLAKLNALADTAPGFVWRLQSDDGNATSLRYFDDPMMIVNMSVWKTVEALKHYTYETVHVEYLKRRKEWFTVLGKPHFVMWWIKAGHIPDIGEATQKLEHLATHGSTQDAFTFSKVFPSPES